MIKLDVFKKEQEVNNKHIIRKHRRKNENKINSRRN